MAATRGQPCSPWPRPEPYHIRDGVTVSNQDRYHLQQGMASGAGLASLPPPVYPRDLHPGTLSAGNWIASPAHGVRFWFQLEAVSKEVLGTQSL